MLRRVVEDQRCQTCHERTWCCITVASGLRRCFRCWLVAYLRLNGQYAAD